MNEFLLDLKENYGLGLFTLFFLAYLAFLAFITTHDFGKNAQSAK